MTLKLYLPLKNKVKGIIFAKDGNVLEYKVKLEALSKPRCNHIVVSKLVPSIKHKEKRKITILWKIITTM